MTNSLSLRTDIYTGKKYLLWNGLVCPMFTEEEAIQLVAKNNPRRVILPNEEEGNE